MSKPVSNTAKGVVSAWRAPEVRPGIETRPPTPSAEQIQAILDQARTEGYAAGHREGLAAGQAEITAAMARLDTLCQSMSEPFAELDAAAEQQLVDLAAMLAEQVLRAELRTRPELLAELIHHSCSLLKGSTLEFTVYLHPEDLALLQDQPGGAALPGRLIARSDLQPGDVLVDSQEQFMDGRLRTLLAELLEVENDKQAGEPAISGTSD